LVYLSVIGYLLLLNRSISAEDDCIKSVYPYVGLQQERVCGCLNVVRPKQTVTLCALSTSSEM